MHPTVPTLKPEIGQLLDLFSIFGGSPATFSCNEDGHIWPWATHGLTPESTRHYVEGRFPILDAVAASMLDVRPTGGRFHLTDEGAFLATDKTMFIRFFLG